MLETFLLVMLKDALTLCVCVINFKKCIKCRQMHSALQCYVTLGLCIGTF